MQNGLNIDKTKFAYVSGHISSYSSGRYGHLHCFFRNLIDRDRFYCDLPEFQISSQISTCEIGERAGEAQVYALKFGLKGETLSLPVLEAATKVARKIDRNLTKLKDELGELPYEPTWAAFTLRHILASGVTDVVIYDSLEYIGLRPDLTQAPRLKVKNQIALYERLQALEAKMLAAFDRRLSKAT